MQSLNPATGKVIRDYPAHDAQAIGAAARRASEAFGRWRKTPIGDRARLLSAVARALREGAHDSARLIALEMGKPIAAAEAEVEKCAVACDHYAEHAARYLAPESVPTEAAESFVRFDPLGPVLAVMPWNFPFWQVFRFAAPALAAGNVGLLKHASNVPGCALAIEDVFRRAGAPESIFQTLLAPAKAIEQLIADPAVAAVTLTGSDAAGRSVASLAGKHLKKAVLELGGSDPFIVLADADIPASAAEAVKARIVNSGQSCIAAKRFIVEQRVAEAFEREFVRRMSELAVGDPMNRDTQVGPLARDDLVADLDAQVRASVAAGARLLLGGSRLDRAGYFYAPTVLADVTPGMPAFDDETFGPVAALSVARDAEEALELANRSRYGLAASLWTRDLARAREFAARIEAGVVFVNGMVKSDPRVPFGGIKASGYGRELGSFGIREFVNVKTVWVT
jgi:succinate-semialdehyde dehydrogenase / glutarate-semialdehyde dehydrogenase